MTDEQKAQKDPHPMENITKEEWEKMEPLERERFFLEHLSPQMAHTRETMDDGEVIAGRYREFIKQSIAKGDSPDALDSPFNSMIAGIEAILDIGIAGGNNGRRVMMAAMMIARSALAAGRRRVEDDDLPLALRGPTSAVEEVFDYVVEDYRKADAVNDLLGDSLGSFLGELLGGGASVRSGPGGIGIILERRSE